MSLAGHDFGRINPKAPSELMRFAFLIGDFHCDAKILSSEGEWQQYKATWHGRFILDGHAIADEFEMRSLSGERLVLGMNLRSYDSAKRTWNIRWLNGLAGDWTDLVSQELGRVVDHGGSIVYAFREPVASHTFTRATYTSHSSTHFTWHGEKPKDGQTWDEFMIVEAYKNP
jgi:hypothetical protein